MEKVEILNNILLTYQLSLSLFFTAKFGIMGCNPSRIISKRNMSFDKLAEL